MEGKAAAQQTKLKAKNWKEATVNKLANKELKKNKRQQTRAPTRTSNLGSEQAGHGYEPQSHEENA